MLTRIVFVFFSVCIATLAHSQNVYDSITISRSLIEENWYGAKWKDTLSAGRYARYIKNEKTVWLNKPGRDKAEPEILALVRRIKTNGTDDIAKCFIPRHSINFYQQGKIARYLLVCFECDGVRFSDDPPSTFIKSEKMREKQMGELKKVFKDL